MQYGFVGWCWTSAHQLSMVRGLERKILYNCLPTNEAFTYDTTNLCYKRIPKTHLYKKFEKLSRFDITVYNSFVKFCNSLEFCDIPLLKEIFNSEHLNDKYLNFQALEKYPFKVFAPSLLYYLHLTKKTVNGAETLTFFNRKFNSNSADEYVYDLTEPP